MNTRGLYEICVRGHLDLAWADWFAPLTIRNQANGEAMLRGHLRDQAELHGMLTKVLNLNLTLIAVRQIDSEADSNDTII
jgi:hypothetical protein